jgi:hypothetical protein
MSAALGRAFFGFFLCTSKERNPPAVRGTAISLLSCAQRTQLSFRESATHKYTWSQAAQMKSRPKGGFVMYRLDARLRWHDGINNFRFRGNDDQRHSR